MDTSRPIAQFYDLEGWEEPFLQEQLPGFAVRGTTEHLGAETAARGADAEVVSVFIHSRLNAETLARLPALRMVAARSTGFDHIDLVTTGTRGIAVANVPTYGENTVAEHAFALILALARNLHRAHIRTSAGNFSLEGLRGFDLLGKRLGIVGAGSIGLHLARMAKGFGMEVVVSDIRQNRLLADVLGFRYVDLNELLATSDVISLHLPYSPAVHHLIDRERLATVKRGALLINTARGGLVDTEALLWALDQGIIGGAGLDVFEGEDVIDNEEALLARPDAEHALRQAMRVYLLGRRENVVLTPHSGFNSHEAVQRILDTTVENINAYQKGKLQNIVSAS